MPGYSDKQGTCWRPAITTPDQGKSFITSQANRFDQGQRLTNYPWQKKANTEMIPKVDNCSYSLGCQVFDR